MDIKSGAPGSNKQSAKSPAAERGATDLGKTPRNSGETAVGSSAAARPADSVKASDQARRSAEQTTNSTSTAELSDTKKTNNPQKETAATGTNKAPDAPKTPTLTATVQSVTQRIPPTGTAATANGNPVIYEASVKLEGALLTVSSTKPLSVGQSLQLQWKDDQTLRVITQHTTTQASKAHTDANTSAAAIKSSAGLSPTVLAELTRIALTNQKTSGTLMQQLNQLASVLAQVDKNNPNGNTTKTADPSTQATAQKLEPATLKETITKPSPELNTLNKASLGKERASRIPLDIGRVAASKTKINGNADTLASAKPTNAEPTQPKAAKVTDALGVTNSKSLVTSGLPISKPETTTKLMPPVNPKANDALSLLQETLKTVLASRVNVDTDLNPWDARAIKTAMQNSGIFLEDSLGQTKPRAVNSDLKAVLGDLFQSLRQLQEQTQVQAKVQTPTSQQVSIKTDSSLSPNNAPASNEQKLFEKSLRLAISALTGNHTAASKAANGSETPASQATSALKLITQEQLLKAAQHKTDLTMSPPSGKDMQAFAQILAGMMRPELQNQKTKSTDKYDQVFQSLLRNIANVIFKVQWNQMASLPMVTEETAQQHSWQFDIPLFSQQQNESVQVRVHKDTQDNNGDKEDPKLTWRVCLDFDFEMIGAIHAELLMQNEDASATVWSENIITYQKTKTQLAQLQNSLLSIGFSSVDVYAEHGIPKRTQQLPISRSLIDVRT